jgi:hypothetical protein
VNRTHAPQLSIPIGPEGKHRDMPRTGLLCDEIDGLLEREFGGYAEQFAGFADELSDLVEAGLTRTQYEIYRNNFLYRTATTMPVLTVLLNNLARRDTIDDFVFNQVLKTLADESAFGTSGATHRVLLEKSHNIHGELVFGLKATALASIDAAPHIFDATRSYRRTQFDLYNSDDLAVSVGAFVAQERAAQSMLSLFYNTLFQPYRFVYDRASKDFDDVAEYFYLHINGVEDAHAHGALVCGYRVCRSGQDAASLRFGVSRFLGAQMAVWRSLIDTLRREQRHGLAVA